MININIENEYSKLKTVILGIADDLGVPPKESDAYDPRSLYHIKNNSYPIEDDLLRELDNFYNKLLKHNVDVIRPSNINNCNQIFARDLGFVISNLFFLSNIVPNRHDELKGIDDTLNNLDVGVIKLPEFMHIEGGDVIVHNDKVFIGTYIEDDYSSLITARTNYSSIDYLKSMITSKEIIPLELNKSNTDIYKNTLHLDCCFQTISNDKAIICPDGFKNKKDVEYLINYFGQKNTFIATSEETFELTSNVLVISPDVIVTRLKSDRLNSWLENIGVLVEKVNYSNVSKMSGLFRCSTLPLNRE
ncbi:MAG: dimethylarginine dimethylaminohydrolase family protein [Candidatus Marisimplicoccus sp.]|jgi:N-dimethylarginine dimethylaminohydrolase|tara:strand:- start:284 stop:1195 length:912 start_codon:yes stop_codon:yes gene_type:complete